MTLWAKFVPRARVWHLWSREWLTEESVIIVLAFILSYYSSFVIISTFSFTLYCFRCGGGVTSVFVFSAVSQVFYFLINKWLVRQQLPISAFRIFNPWRKFILCVLTVPEWIRWSSGFRGQCEQWRAPASTRAKTKGSYHDRHRARMYVCVRGR